MKKDDANQTLLQAFQYGSTNARLIDYDPAAGVNKFYASVGGTVMAEYTEYAQYVFTWTKSYTYLGDSLLSTVTPNGAGGEATEYNHPDRLGTRLVTNQQLGTSYEQAHLPFGRPLNAESSLTTNNKRFTSYDRSAATGLDYAINRTYDSKLGRFMQVDPIGMSSVSLASPQTLNMYAYCANDPINYTDPSGLFFGKLFKWISKVFKWIMLAVTIAVAILTVVGTFMTPVAFAAFMKTTLGQVLGFIAGIPGLVGKYIMGIPKMIKGIFTFAAEASRMAGLLGSVVLAGGAAVGAVANSFSSNDDLDDPVIFDKTFTAIFDAFEVLRKDLKCAKFFGLTDAKGRFSQKKFDQFIKDIKIKVNVNGGPHMAQTVGKNMTFNGKFYKDGVFRVSPAPYSLKNPRQGRAQTVLHELGHVKGVLLSNDAGGYPNDPNTRGNQNEKKILDNCGKGLAGLPPS